MTSKTDQIEKEIEKIEAAQEKIEEHEKKIDITEHKILNTLNENPLDLLTLETGSPQTKAEILRYAIVKKISKNKLFFGLLITFALVAIWRGIWDLMDASTIPYNEAIFFLIGVVILVVIKKLSELGH